MFALELDYPMFHRRLVDLSGFKGSVLNLEGIVGCGLLSSPNIKVKDRFVKRTDHCLHQRVRYVGCCRYWSL